MFWLSLALAELPPEALTALRRGDCGSALDALEGVEGLEAEVARSRCGAPSRLDEHLGDGGVIEGYARLLVAREAVESKPAQAEEVLAGLTLPGEAGLEVRLLRARARINQDESLEAREDLRALLSTSVAAEARYWLAYGAETRGDTDPAVVTYRACWAKAISPWDQRAAERLEGLGHPVPDFSSPEARSLALERARTLVKQHKAPEAIPLYDGITEATGEEGSAWTYEVAFALFKAKDYERSMEWMGRLEPTSGSQRGGADTLFHYALGTSRTGDYEAAAAYYTRLFELYPGTKTADTASYKVAYLSYDAGDLDKAIPLFWKHLERYPASQHKDEALWFIGWSHYRLGQLEDSEKALDALLVAHGGSSLAPGALYWKARIRGRQGDPTGEEEALSRLLNNYPVSGHAWYAAERLGRSFAGVEDPQAPDLPASLASKPALVEAQALAAAGQWDWARERLLTVVPSAKGSRSSALALGAMLVDVGAYQQAQALAAPYCPKPWRAAEAPDAVPACFPRPEFPVVAEAASATGLNPLLPYAIMTAESALDPSVTSIAGARGLMQLMPELGQELHGSLLPGVPYDPDRLYVAGYNAWLGTTELGRLYTRFDGAGVEPRLPLAIAGYNGGDEAVARWVSEYDEAPDVDWFAENISYSETRRYVRRVLGYLMSYRWVYGD